MSETTARPRRKATINKTYNDSIDLNSLEYDSLNSISASTSVNLTTSNTRKRTNNSNNTNGSNKNHHINMTTIIHLAMVLPHRIKCRIIGNHPQNQRIFFV